MNQETKSGGSLWTRFTRAIHSHVAGISFLFLLFLLSLIPYDVIAQTPDLPVPEVSSSVDRVEVFVGDAVSLTVSVIADSSIRVAPLAIEKKLGDFEIQDIQRLEPEIFDAGRKRHRTVLKLWALEVGDHQIPSIAVSFANPGAEVKVDSVLTSAITVTVVSVVGENIDSALIMPLSEPLEDPLGLNKGILHSRTFWGLLIATALIVGALVWWVVLRKRKEEAEWVDPRSSWEIALDSLAELRNQPYLEQALFKRYYSDLTDTLRDYLGSALQTHTQDMTTAELLASLEADALTVVYRPQIADLLSQADMIKFARAIPTTERPKQDFEITYSVIISIRDDIVERQRKDEARKRELELQNRSLNGAKTEGESGTESNTTVDSSPELSEANDSAKLTSTKEASDV